MKKKNPFKLKYPNFLRTGILQGCPELTEVGDINPTVLLRGFPLNTCCDKFSLTTYTCCLLSSSKNGIQELEWCRSMKIDERDFKHNRQHWVWNVQSVSASEYSAFVHEREYIGNTIKTLEK